jgi:hypothetical protein
MMMMKHTSLLIFAGAFALLISSAYAAFFSKLLPPSSNPILAWIREDSYYCLLVPLTIPMTFVAIYFHWLNLRLFTNN